MDFSINETPFIGRMFGETRSEKAGAAQGRSMQRAANDYAAYRPIQYQQRMNALTNLAGLFSPVNNAMGQMYGSGAQLDLGKILNSPVVTQNLWPGFGLPQPGDKPYNPTEQLFTGQTGRPTNPTDDEASYQVGEARKVPAWARPGTR